MVDGALGAESVDSVLHPDAGLAVQDETTGIVLLSDGLSPLTAVEDGDDGDVTPIVVVLGAGIVADIDEEEVLLGVTVPE